MNKIITVKAEDIRKLLQEAEISVTTQFDKVTVVCVKLKSGFVITEAAGAVDPRNYSEEIGKEVCLERIERKLWEMEGYALQKKHPVADNAMQFYDPELLAGVDESGKLLAKCIREDIPIRGLPRKDYKQYIGTKTVQAAPALRIESEGNVRVELLADKPVTMPTDTVDMGYKVIYPDGYESFCPLDAFEEAYRPTDGMNFGLAIEAAKRGKRIARKGWNGKGQYVEIGTDFAYRTTDDQGVLVAHEDIGTQALVFVGTRGRQVGWLASQADMLADDWYIVE